MHINQEITCELLVTTLCNFACRYCIASDLPKSNMNYDTGCKAIDYVFYLSQGAKTINLVFTGGEPLLVTSLLKMLIEYAIDKSQIYGYSLIFHVKTNGSIVNPDVIELALRFGVSFTVSIDGKDVTHDGMRVTLNSDVTHQFITTNLRLLLDKGIECSCNVTIDPQHASDVTENIDYLVNLGIKNFSVGPAYGTVKWNEKQIEALTDSFIRLHNKYKAGNSINAVFINPIHNCMIHKNDFFAECWGCEALHSNISILPTGEICGCSALAYLSNQYPFLIIGDVHNGLISEAEKYMLEIIDGGIDLRMLCQDCSSKNNCYGGCYAINISCNGLPYLPPPIYCSAIKVLSNLD